MTTLLSQVRKLLTVDVDSMDPAVASKFDADPFCDMTSNQAIFFGQLGRPENKQLLEETLKVNRVAIDSEVDQAMDIIDTLTVLYAKAVLPHITGRVHAQTSPSMAYNTEGTVAHAKRLVDKFQSQGIPRDRVCIKIPVTPESVVACKQLEAEGIRTLGTCLFSVAQAMAASQAECLYVAPYFNELRVHFEPSVWKEYENTVAEHPMCPVIHSIVGYYKHIGSKTLVMPASIVTSDEVIALTSLGPDHLTLSGLVLEQLSELKQVQEDKLQATPLPSSALDDAILKTEYLANGGAALGKAIQADAETARKLEDALKIFGEMEEKAMAHIREALANISEGKK